MSQNKSEQFRSKLTLVSMAILTYHLALFFAGQLEVRRLGGMYFLLMAGSALLITFQTRFVVREPTDREGGWVPRDSDRMADDGKPVMRPTIRRYLTLILSMSAWSWLALLVLERLGRNSGAEVPWPATNIWAPFVILCAYSLLLVPLAIHHFRMYRRATKPWQDRSEADGDDGDSRAVANARDCAIEPAAQQPTGQGERE